MIHFAFTTISITLCIILFATLYHRFVRSIQNPKWKKIFQIFLFLLFTGMAIVPLFRRHTPSFLPLQWQQHILALYFLLLGFMSFIMTYLFLAFIAEKIYYFVRKIIGKPVETTRRVWLTHVFNFAILSLSGVSTIVGMIICAQRPDIYNVTIPFKKMPDDLKNFKIVQISDLHIDGLASREWLQDVVDRVNAMRPSLVAITGDLIDAPLAQSSGTIELISKLQSTYGTYFVTGNHEYYSGPEEWIPYFKKLGLKVLENENVLLQIGKSTIMIAGVPDQAFPIKPDPQRAITNPQGKADLSILLAHRPQSCFDAVKAGFNLQLSGHSHAGQFFPWTFVVKFIQPYVKGLHNLEGMWIYVNQGTGFWGPPIRLGTHSEITQIHFDHEQ